MSIRPQPLVVWGVTASPYMLKMQSLLDYWRHDQPGSWERWPEQASMLSALSTARALQRAKRRGEVARFPARNPELDEYPAVPFYTLDGSQFFYDSSGLALHLDQLGEGRAPGLIPREPALAFLCHLIDEAFDEFGLYMVHHMRWVGSARTTQMGHRTARQLRAPPGLRGLLARRLYHRQVRRCPYLFSVAPEGYVAGVAARRTPPARAGFPATHALLESAWHEYLAAMEQLLRERPFILGDQFTLADASAYGQLGMNLDDPEAADLLQATAPRTFDWLRAIAAGRHGTSEGALSGSPALQRLLDAICATFVPLMQQNTAAYERERRAGQTVFNEAAFDRGIALYDGDLMGHPFRAVVKTFQVQVWRDLQARWSALSPAQRASLEADYGLPAAALTRINEDTRTTPVAISGG